MKTIVEKLVENSLPEEEARELVASARQRLREGESPVDILSTYQERIKSNNLLDILPDER